MCVSCKCCVLLDRAICDRSTQLPVKRVQGVSGGRQPQHGADHTRPSSTHWGRNFHSPLCLYMYVIG